MSYCISCISSRTRCLIPSVFCRPNRTGVLDFKWILLLQDLGCLIFKEFFLLVADTTKLGCFDFLKLLEVFLGLQFNTKNLTKMSYFVPPCNYGMVEYDLSRSGQCHQLNFPFLERLNLKTVIYLSYDQPSHAFLSFLDDQGIELRRPSGGDEETDNLSSLMSEAEVLSALQVILSPQNYPLHVMCKFGHHRTGTVIGCLRKLQGWNLTAIFEEYRRYAGSKVRFLNEQFIELFDTDLVRIPVDHPAWL